MKTDQEGEGARWVFLFLLRTFFGACGDHNQLNNHQNRYCIECDKAACQHCVAEGPHNDHRNSVLTIYKLVYQDVVSLTQISRHLNCSKIQPYTSNGRLVLALSPLPHYGSGSLKPQLACRFCARKLMDGERYKFCSIACKYQITTGKPTTKPKPKPEKGNGRDGGAGPGTNNGGSVHRRKSLPTTSRRKGIPVRSPLR